MIRRILAATFIGLIIGIYFGPSLIPIPDLITKYVYGGLLGALVGGLAGVIWAKSDKVKQKKIMMIRIKRSHFRILLIIYTVMIVIPMLIGLGMDYSSCQYPKEYLTKFALLGLIASVIMLFMYVMLVTSLIGMFFFKSFARYLFIIANIFPLLIHPTLLFFEKLLIGKQVMSTLNCNIAHSPVVVLVGTLFSLLTLAIIIIPFTQFGSHLFQKKETEVKP